MADSVDRSVLESKGVAELRAIAKSLDLKTTGLKKAELIDIISRSDNGGKPSGAETRAVKREPAPPLDEAAAERSGNGTGTAEESGRKESRDKTSDRRAAEGPSDRETPSDEGSSGESGRGAVRDEAAVDDRRSRMDDEGHLPLLAIEI